MARFLVTYHSETMPHDPESMAQARGLQAWAAKTGDALVDPGAPIQAMMTVSTDGRRDGPVSRAPNGWSVLEAASIDEAAATLSGHPFIGCGGQLQINQPAEL